MSKVVKHARKYESTAQSNFELEMGSVSEQPIERGLATFQDQEEQTVTVCPDAVPRPSVGNPYPDQTAKAICERWYSIDSKSLTKTTATGTYLLTPFYSLVNQAVLQEALSSFRYVRWSHIELRIQNSTMPQMYGWVGYSSLPVLFYPTGALYDEVLSRLSFQDATLFDIAVQNDVTSIIPWRAPDQWCDWYDQYQLATANDVDAAYNRATLLWPANPVHVLSSTATPTVTFQIFARFQGFETSAHVNSRDDLVVEGQSKYMETASSFFNVMKDVTLNIPQRGLDPNSEFRAEIMPHYNKSNEEKAQSPTVPPEDPDLRNNPYGSTTFSSGRYVAGTGTQIAPHHNYTIRDIIRMPSCHQVSSILSSDTLRLIEQCQPDATWSYLGYMSQMFRMWRGSIDYTIVFFSSPFISARFNVVVAWGKTAPTGTIGNEIVKDVTIRGTTVVQITVPFLNGGQWAPTYWQRNAAYDGYISFPRLYIKVVQPPVSVGDISCDIPYVLFKRAGVDFEFRSLISPAPKFDDPPVVEGQMLVSSLMSAEVTGGGGLVVLPNTSDTELSINDMCRRWSGRKCSGAYYKYPSPVKEPYITNKHTLGVFDTLAQLFCFWSGQIRIKGLPDTGSLLTACWHTRNFINASGVDGMEACQRPEDGMAVIQVDLTQVLDVTCPFLATTQFLPIPDPNSLLYSYSFPLATTPRLWWDGFPHYEDGSDVDFDLFYIAGGEDYSLYLPIPPPALTFWPSNGFKPSLDLQNVYRKGHGIVTETCSTSDEQFHVDFQR